MVENDCNPSHVTHSPDDHSYDLDVHSVSEDIFLILQRLLSDSRVPDDCKRDIQNVKGLLLKDKSSAFRAQYVHVDAAPGGDVSGVPSQDPELYKMLAYQLRLENTEQVLNSSAKPPPQADATPRRMSRFARLSLDLIAHLKAPVPHNPSLLFSEKLIQSYPSFPTSFKQISSWDFDVFRATSTGPDGVNEATSLSGV